MNSGKRSSSAAPLTSATAVSTPLAAGAGRPARRAASRARSLLPAIANTSAGGPTNVIPAATHWRASSGFSDMNP